MPRDHRLYLDDMLEAIGRIRRHVGAMDFAAFKADEKTVDAVIRNLEIIWDIVQHKLDDLESACRSLLEPEPPSDDANTAGR